MFIIIFIAFIPPERDLYLKIFLKGVNLFTDFIPFLFITDGQQNT